MAPLRSSRSTRNQDHSAASRNRPGIVDLDPTEGLPVQKWEQITVRVNQDPSSDPAAAVNLPQGTTATSSAEWSAQFGTPQFPWQEKPLPSFYSQLSPWNQEMLRRARTGNTSAKLSVWERKSNSWISAAEAEKRHNPLKSVHLNNVEANANSKQNANTDSPAHDEDEDHDEKSDDEIDGENGDDEVGPATTTGMKRRKKYTPEERIFEVKRWVQMPSAIADKTEERKFLADRRPGMPSLYGGSYQNQIFGSMGLNTNGYGFSAANAGYDLGDGGGLGNAGGMLQSNEGASTPVRKNMPPKRKKKKGGPGRKKANPDPAPQADGDTVAGELLADGTVIANPAQDTTMIEADNEGSDSGSEAEGSEEGEIDEGGRDNENQNGHMEDRIEPSNKDGSVAPAHLTTDAQDGMLIPTESNTTDSKEVEAIQATTDLGGDESKQIPSSVAERTAEDVAMQDRPAEEISPNAVPESTTQPATISPVIQPTVLEEHPKALLPTESSHEEMIEAVPAPILPIPDPIVNVLPPQPQEILQPVETQPQSEPEPTMSISALVTKGEQQPEASSEPEANLAPPSVIIPGAGPDSLEPRASIPPTSAVVAENANEPSDSIPDTEPIAKPSTEAPTAPMPVDEITPAAGSESMPSINTDQALRPLTEVATLPEPTSPDLLGGLEDELNKNMGEENAG